jgi:hypothetical protein
MTRKSAALWPHFNFASTAFQGAMLAFEANQVIALRLTKMAFGGPGVEAEAELMVSEKLESLAESGGVMMRAAMVGAHDLGAEKIVRLYRRKVRANRRRLAS